MAITLVNRERSELTIYIGKDNEKLIFKPGERKDGIDEKKCPDIKSHPFVKEGWIEVFGDIAETATQKKAREKAEADAKAKAKADAEAKSKADAEAKAKADAAAK